MLVNPKWLMDLAGYREREIMLADDAFVTNFVETGDTHSLERFPEKDKLWQIVSPTKGRMLVSSKLMRIVG